MALSPYIECGKIINTHGCHGGIKIESWCNSPETLAQLKNLYIKTGDVFQKYPITKAAVFKQFVVATSDAISSMDEALALKEKIVFALRTDFTLSEDEYFLADLVGLPVIDAENQRVYGKLLEVINRGASDIYVIQTHDGERMMPAVDEFIDHIDLTKGIFVRPIDGMLD